MSGELGELFLCYVCRHCLEPISLLSRHDGSNRRWVHDRDIIRTATPPVINLKSPSEFDHDAEPTTSPDDAREAYANLRLQTLGKRYGKVVEEPNLTAPEIEALFEKAVLSGEVSEDHWSAAYVKVARIDGKLGVLFHDGRGAGWSAWWTPSDVEAVKQRQAAYLKNTAKKEQ